MLAWLLLMAGAFFAPPAQAQTNAFVENPELKAITDLLNQGRLAEAKQRATEIINRPSRAFQSAKREQQIKASALYSRSFAESRLGMDAAAITDARRAASMGHATAAMYYASLQNAAAREETDPAKRSDLQAQIESHLRMAAELGDPMAIADLERILTESGRPERHYWQLLNILGQKEPRKLSEFLRWYREDLSDADRGLLAKAMREQSVSGGEARPADKRMPGRSTLTAAVVDLAMRSALGLSWRSFFNPKADPSDETVDASLQRHAQASRRYPFVEMYFVTRPPIHTKYRPTVALPTRKDLAGNVLPGDSIIVRCGILEHEAIVWETRRETGRLLLLDPFAEFWGTKNNSCFPSSSTHKYKHERELVRLSWREVEPRLEAFVTLRDAPAAAIDTAPPK